MKKAKNAKFIYNKKNECIGINLGFDFVAEHEYKNGYVMWPIRTAVSGKAMTPGGATELMEILGKEESLSRIKKAIELLQQ